MEGYGSAKVHDLMECLVIMGSFSRSVRYPWNLVRGYWNEFNFLSPLISTDSSFCTLTLNARSVPLTLATIKRFDGRAKHPRTEARVFAAQYSVSLTIV